MKIKLIKAFLAVLSITFALTSCSSNEDIKTPVEVVNQSIGFQIQNGIMRFKNVHEFDKTIRSLKSMSENELKIFRTSLAFKSLYDCYNEVGTPIDSTNTRVADSYLTMLLNKDGVLMVNDTILKIYNEKAFIIPDSDFSALTKICNNEDITDNSKIKIIQHTKRFSKLIAIDNDGIARLRGSSSQYDGNVETGLLKYGTCCTPREERVQLRGFCVISPFFPFGFTYIGAAINGEARQKDVCFFGCSWGGWFADEINYGKITINSGKYGPQNNCIYNVNTGYQIFTTPNTEFLMAAEYGPTNDLYAKDLNVTYVYQKTPGRSTYSTNIIWQ